MRLLAPLSIYALSVIVDAAQRQPYARTAAAALWLCLQVRFFGSKVFEASQGGVRGLFSCLRWRSQPFVRAPLRSKPSNLSQSQLRSRKAQRLDAAELIKQARQ